MLKGSTLTNITNADNSIQSSISLKDTSNPWHKHSKTIFLILMWICSTAFMTTEYEKKMHHKLISIDNMETRCKFVFFSPLFIVLFFFQFFVYILAYMLPKIYYGEQILLGLEGAFLEDSNDTSNQVTVKLMSGSRPIDVRLI